MTIQLSTMTLFPSQTRRAVLAVMGLLVSGLVSCSPSSPSVQQTRGGKAEIEFWTMQLSPKFDGYFQQLIANFETQNPGIAVRWVDVPWTAMQSKILTAVSAKTAPDVVNLNPDFASQLAGRKAWLWLDGKVTDRDRNQYFPKIWRAGTLEGQSFGIPWYLTTRVMIYNTQLLKQAGITQPPATYAQLAQLAKQVRQKTGKFAFFTTVVPEDSAEILESMVQMGVTLVDANGKAAFNNPIGKQAFQYWVDLYQSGLLPKEVLTQGHRQGIELYQAGETALLMSSPEFLNTIGNNAPAIAAVSATAPQISGDTQKKNVAVMNLVIPRDSDQPDAALKFALFVTNADNQLTFAKAANVLPSTAQALKDPFFTTLPPNRTAVDQARIVSANQLKTAEVLIPVIKDIKVLQKIIYNQLQAAMLGQKTASQATADAASEWDGR